MDINNSLSGFGFGRVGIAYSSYTSYFLEDHFDQIDYIEVPFEQLVAQPDALKSEKVKQKPIILHSASMSLASEARPAAAVVDALAHWISETKTPWLGEHLSFILAEKNTKDCAAQADSDGIYNTGYSISSALNENNLEILVTNIQNVLNYSNIPLVIENPPLYFNIPGSTLSQVDFINQVLQNTQAGLLLDLSHFYISSLNLGFDAKTEIQKLHLDRMVEVHVSGIDNQAGVYWDNHADRAPKEVFELLSLVCKIQKPRAVTLEYNWSARFAQSVLLEEIALAKQAMRCNLAKT